MGEYDYLNNDYHWYDEWQEREMNNYHDWVRDQHIKAAEYDSEFEEPGYGRGSKKDEGDRQ